MSYQKKLKVIVRDDLPRFTSFVISLPNCDGNNSTLPPMMKIPLPYQVLANGRIIASQLLKMQLIWSPFEGWNDSTTGYHNLRRLVLDAQQSPIQYLGQPVACDPILQPDFLSAPYTLPSVISCTDRVTVTSAGAADAETASCGLSQNQDVDFGCMDEYPIVPSGTLNAYGFWITNAALAQFGARVPDSTNIQFGFRDIFKRAVTPNYPPSTAGWSADNVLGQPFVQVRLWYKVVELSPYQHLMIVSKYTNKLPTGFDEAYEKLKNTGSSTAGVYPNVSQNPNSSINVTPWFGS